MHTYIRRKSILNGVVYYYMVLKNTISVSVSLFDDSVQCELRIRSVNKTKENKNNNKKVKFFFCVFMKRKK